MISGNSAFPIFELEIRGHCGGMKVHSCSNHPMLSASLSLWLLGNEEHNSCFCGSSSSADFSCNSSIIAHCFAGAKIFLLMAEKSSFISGSPSASALENTEVTFFYSMTFDFRFADAAKHYKESIRIFSCLINLFFLLPIAKRSPDGDFRHLVTLLLKLHDESTSYLSFSTMQSSLQLVDGTFDHFEWSSSIFHASN